METLPTDPQNPNNNHASGCRNHPCADGDHPPRSTATADRVRRRNPRQHIPAHDHATWCRYHDDAGMFDQLCRAEDVRLFPESGTESDPGMCSVRVEQRQDREPDTAAWTVHTPHVHLQIVHGDGTAGTWLTAVEAFELAELLTDAVHQADTETARSDR